MDNYVLGFMFSRDCKNVALIQKIKPEWQAGKLNGIGGKCEDSEPPLDAMMREFEEETGVPTMPSQWSAVAQAVARPEVVVYVYAQATDRIIQVQTRTEERTEERIGIFPANAIPVLKIIPNLLWLVPLCSAYLNIPEESRPRSPMEIFI